MSAPSVRQTIPADVARAPTPYGIGSVRVLGYLDLSDPTEVEALIREPLAWEGVVLPIHTGQTAQAQGLSLKAVEALRRAWPSQLDFIAAPADEATWRHLQALQPGSILLNTRLARRVINDPLLCPTDAPLLLSAGELSDDEMARLASSPLHVERLILEATGPSVLDLEVVERFLRLKRWGWSVGCLSNATTREQLFQALVVSSDTVLLRVHGGAPGGTRTMVQRLHGLLGVFAAFDGLPWAMAPTPEALDRYELHRPALVAARPLAAGTRITADDLRAEVGRPAVSAEFARGLEGSEVLFPMREGEAITYGVVEPPRVETSIGGALRVSVVLRSKNEAAWIGRCVRAIRSQWGVGPVEIILVDNESTDETVAIARALGCRVLTIRDADFTYGRALNRGIDATRGELVAIMSAHCIPVNDLWLVRLCSHFHAHTVAGVYGRQEPLPDSSDFDKRDLWTTFGLERKVQRKDHFFHNANCMIRKAIWTWLPFHEELRGVEDRAWAKEVLRTGRQVVYEPGASAYHYHGIHQGRDELRAHRVARVIEMIHRGVGAEAG